MTGKLVFNQIPCTHKKKYTCISTDKYFLDAFICSLGEQMPALRVMSGNDDQYNAAYNRDEPEVLDVAFLNSTDPNEFLVS